MLFRRSTPRWFRVPSRSLQYPAETTERGTAVMKVLVIGKVGREHALVWKLAQSPRVDQVFCAPGQRRHRHGRRQCAASRSTISIA